MSEPHDPKSGDDASVCPRCHGTGAADGDSASQPEAVIFDETLPSEEKTEPLQVAAHRSATLNRTWIVATLLVLFTLSMIASPVAAAFLPEPKGPIEEINKARDLIVPIVSLIVGYYFGTQSGK